MGQFICRRIISCGNLKQLTEMPRLVFLVSFPSDILSLQKYFLLAKRETDGNNYHFYSDYFRDNHFSPQNVFLSRKLKLSQEINLTTKSGTFLVMRIVWSRYYYVREDQIDGKFNMMHFIFFYFIGGGEPNKNFNAENAVHTRIYIIKTNEQWEQ